ncbi:CPBP family intramembrane glutamic endopeptidase [Pedobacter frigiditerrae]|uniref:CPBP family intramembrane glutamic endopeptidase n=1 Tax=Pedobacter frigiditerrae TaxID=2530452 RepID=UPI00292D9843|nr:CPBP family intramembrane glutamic endopeptidase [Pedobacter frigiditerrae]
MQFTIPTREENHPFLQLLILVAGAIVGVIVFAVIGFVICLGIYGLDLIRNLEWTTGSDLRYVGALKILITAQQIGFFLVPAVALAIFEGKKPHHFYGMKTPNINLLGIVFLLMLCATPLLGWVNEWNMNLHLPESFSKIEKWMREMEDQGAVTTKAILAGKSFGALAINLFVVGLVPAICEELIFRGGLQRTFLRLIKNPHVAIWLSAIIFSTIHFQFFGFFPRLFLGAMFGYIYFWTKNIWYTIFAHFLNNAYAVTLMWYFQRNNLPMDKADETNIAWYGYLISAILTIALFWILKDKTTKKEEVQQEI